MFIIFLGKPFGRVSVLFLLHLFGYLAYISHSWLWFFFSNKEYMISENK